MQGFDVALLHQGRVDRTMGETSDVWAVIGRAGGGADDAC